MGNETANGVTRVGIYGGTFSPPHNGHVHAAEAFLSLGGIDRLLIVPTFVTPLKEREENTSPADRLAMCERAFAHLPATEVSDIEIRRAGKSYTAQTLAALTAPDVRLSFLCGTDMLLSMGSWYEPATIFRLARIVCMRRENEAENGRLLAERAEEYRRRFDADIAFLSAPPKEMSSSQIRERIGRGEDVSTLLPADVLAYINERGLYR